MATKQEILEYVMNTPGNTNPNVLAPMLESISGQTPTVFEATGEYISPNVVFTLTDTENEPVMGDILQITFEEEDPLTAYWVVPFQTILLPQSGLRSLIYNEEGNFYLLDIDNFIPQVSLNISVDNNSSNGTIYITTAPVIGNNQIVSLTMPSRATESSITVTSPFNSEAGSSTFMVAGVPQTSTDTLYVVNSSNVEYSLDGNSCTILVPFSDSASYISFGFREGK